MKPRGRIADGPLRFAYEAVSQCRHTQPPIHPLDEMGACAECIAEAIRGYVEVSCMSGMKVSWDWMHNVVERLCAELVTSVVCPGEWSIDFYVENYPPRIAMTCRLVPADKRRALIPGAEHAKYPTDDELRQVSVLAGRLAHAHRMLVWRDWGRNTAVEFMLKPNYELWWGCEMEPIKSEQGLGCVVCGRPAGWFKWSIIGQIKCGLCDEHKDCEPYLAFGPQMFEDAEMGVIHGEDQDSECAD